MGTVNIFSPEQKTHFKVLFSEDKETVDKIVITPLGQPERDAVEGEKVTIFDVTYTVGQSFRYKASNCDELRDIMIPIEISIAAQKGYQFI